MSDAIKKRIVAGIIAHVDSGKTTLSESLLFTAGEIRKMGRVDHKDAFLDTNEIERDRGITIFAKQAQITVGDTEITLLDTPGHVDFSAETERTLRVLDYAILVINGGDGVQSHTETLWNLLRHYNIPTFIFVNKMDLPETDKGVLLEDIKKRLDEGAVDFGLRNYSEDEFYENIAMCDSDLLDIFFEDGFIEDDVIRDEIAARKVFPVFFGSALKNEGVAELLGGFEEFTSLKHYPKDFAGKVFKVSEDEKGQRLTHIKITGGSLKVKTTPLIGGREQKINDIRVYSGVKYKSIPEALPGSVVAVPGLLETFAGQGLGTEMNSEELVSEPIFTYAVKLPAGVDVTPALAIFRKLEEEESQFNVSWNEHLQKINVQVMGEIQLEVLKRILKDRFDMEVEFENGSIIYRETIDNTVEGVGHYEPLRHYAEVHLLLEPLPRGSGIVLNTRVNEEVLEKNWQRLVHTHLVEKTHIGVLTGSPITDIKITLVSGKAHLKHTEGGDFRQATYRAVRHGLMNAVNVLLEPWYKFKLEVPTDATGRALTDLQQMGAKVNPLVVLEDETIITGSVPVSQMRDYYKSVVSYTHGKGRLNLTPGGYDRCLNAEEVVDQIGYIPDADLDNSPDSVFCSHGAGYVVKWYDVYKHMHLPLRNQKKEEFESLPVYVPRTYSSASDEELLAIFEKTYGKIKETKLHNQMRTPRGREAGDIEAANYRGKEIRTKGPKYLLVDGYNIIFAWEDLKKVSEENLDLARTLLINRLANYKAMKDEEVIIVFDAYKIAGQIREIEKINGISVVYTKEAETADQFIEKTSREMSKHNQVRVATNDNLERLIILGHGASRISAEDFLNEVKAVEAEIKEYID
ncbi:MAG: TetM/TetW/TetO/TetS family tetracycline resistance ribosomal protection protein [Firmicutes bacterium]|nr:TetM/TetW/TetO/TetS family tetracycline resistance ribosomal protection protein [Bacillota bacterium]